VLVGMKRCWAQLSVKTKRNTVIGTALAVLAAVIAFSIAHPVMAGFALLTCLERGLRHGLWNWIRNRRSPAPKALAGKS
jgi:hypothetical protein